jgi:hypothetical protein
MSVCLLRHLVKTSMLSRLSTSFLWMLLFKMINMKNCEALVNKVVIGRAVTALKQQKSKGKGDEIGITEIVYLMKPITRSPDNSSSSNNNNNNNNYS